MTETFGQYIRSLREGKGLTQRALSQAVGFRSLAHLSDIESGKRNPAKETLPKFAKALGVSLIDIESRDTRGPIEAAKALFARKPEMVGAFLKVIEAAKKMDAEELVSRVTLKQSKPEAPAGVPASVPAPVAEVVSVPPKLEIPRPAPKPVPEKKPSDQPTLF
ncbi:MAG: helix-turn-helix transcriptional regulator [Verrucomicrobia bacterium]|nr:helix-turn-helix transcriptional regulator [Verrucomicrobiota bacterium]